MSRTRGSTTNVRVFYGDCRRVLPTFAAASVDAVVTDPPYELGFMGKRWDASGVAYDLKIWAECLRVLKPGGYLLAFGGTRTYHRMVCAIEDAGFEIRDSIHWVYGSGFPKSRNVSKAIDEAAGAERTIVGHYVMPFDSTAPGCDPGNKAVGWTNVPNKTSAPSRPITAPATDAAKRWDGWGTALKPTHEPIVVARKPLAGTVADNVLRYGTGAINVDDCRVAVSPADAESMQRVNTPGSDRWRPGIFGGSGPDGSGPNSNPYDPTPGRWPPNLLLTHDPNCVEDVCVAWCAVREMDEQSGMRKDGAAVNRNRSGLRPHTVYGEDKVPSEDVGFAGASRFFPVFRYTAKASRRERPQVEGVPPHPTVKPLALMRWLVRLVTPPGGLVLDPFAGSGATLEAARLEGFDAVGVESEDMYRPHIEMRLRRSEVSRGEDVGHNNGTRARRGTPERAEKTAAVGALYELPLVWADDVA